MAEIDAEAIVRALEKKAQDKILAKRLANPDFEKDQIRIDKQVQEDGGILSKLKFPDKETQIQTNLAMVKRLDDVGRVVGNPFGVGDALEAGMSSEKTLEESRAATAAARQRLGPNLAKALEMGGEIGATIATTPLAIGVKGAALIGGAQSLVSDTAEKFFKEDRLPTMLEAVTATGLGAGISGLGQFMGNRLARWFVEKGAAKTPVTQGADRAIKAATQKLGRAFKFADESDASVSSAELNKFIVDTMNNPKLVAKGLDPNVDKGVWNGFNSLRARVGRLEPGQSLTVRELADARTMMRDLAARGASRTDTMFDIDRAFSKFVGGALAGNPKGQLAWKMIDQNELPRIQGEFLANLSDKAELAASSGKGPIDKMIQDQFINLVTSDSGRKLMVKLGFSPEQKELFREAAHGTNSTVLANKLDRVMGSTWLAPFYRTTLQPLLRARGGSTSTGDLTQILGETFEKPAGDIVAPTVTGMPQLTAPIAPQITPSIQQQMGSPPPGAGGVTPGQPAMAPSAPPQGSPQRMPRPLTEQPARGPVPNLPKP